MSRQIGADGDRRTSHELDLHEAMLPAPQRESFIRPMPGGDVALELWLVLDEDPVRQRGYLIFFNEVTGAFGLAVRDAGGRRICIGEYGDLPTTLESM